MSPASSVDAAEHCITCGDEGIPMQVRALAAPGSEAVCLDACGAPQLVALDLLDGVSVGESVLVHAGVAIARAAAPASAAEATA
ncbi:MAG: HypC/HybG/HupF family hydrogenase formation chaperone [Solirubrobacteraceae bacterium]